MRPSLLLATVTAAAGGLCAVATTALADDDPDYSADTSPPPPPPFVVVHPTMFYEPEAGVSLVAGGGVEGFADSDLEESLNTGGGWNVRATFGTRAYLALEAAYIGSAQSIDALGVDQDAVLVGNGAEAAVRLNLAPAEVFSPFLFAGAAWRHYSMSNADGRNLSDLRGTDDVGEVPMGAGIAVKSQGLMLELRGAYRPSFDDDLIAGSRNGDIADVDLDRWSANLNLGYEF